MPHYSLVFDNPVIEFNTSLQIGDIVYFVPAPALGGFNMGELDNIDDLNKAREIINDRRNSLARKTKYSLVVGEEVTITGSGKIESGKIIKINRTKAVVDCFDKKRDCMVTYDVPFTMIRKMEV